MEFLLSVVGNIIARISPAVKSGDFFREEKPKRLCFHPQKCIDKQGIVWYNIRVFIGMSPSGKAPDFDSGSRRFESGHPSQQKRHAVGVPFLLAERCVPLARNVMRPSGVMFASQVMCATAREERNTSHHFAPKAQYITMAKP